MRGVKIIIAGLALLIAAPAYAADSFSAPAQSGFVRLDFNFAPAAKLTASTSGGVLIIGFDRKVDVDPAAIVAASHGAIASFVADADGKNFRFALNQPVRLHQSAVGGHAVVDIAPVTFAGAMPDLPKPATAPPKPLNVAELPELKLRAGSYSNFTRLVFDWAKETQYSVFPGAGKMTIRFGTQVKPDLSVIARQAPPWVKNAAWRIEGGGTIVEFETDSESGFHDFRDGTKIVLDILAPKTDAAAYTPPGTAKPIITAMAAKAGASSAQAAAIADTANKLATKKPDPKVEAKVEAKTEPKPEAKPVEKVPEIKAVEAKPEVAPVPETQTADSKVSGSTATLSFKGAGARASAVFVRGLTAWIVLADAPAFDPVSLKSALTGFSTSLEASSSPGISVLRIGLNAPAQIAARSEGADLKVVIAGQAGDVPTAIGFARNQDDPKRASLTTLLPGAEKLFNLTDPVTGDILGVIPANSGRAMNSPRAYAEFAALQTASGLVISAYADDLAITVSHGRIAITKSGGLTLTPPEMPVAETPSAMAGHDGPAYLDFAHWGVITGGSFLATERRLAQSVSRLSAAKANQARLNLARFYLANRFAAEALGLIKLVEAADPAMAGDAQLAVMRASANYMIGRYRDAHNGLAGAQFDADRHAALWRGLSEAALENWQGAHDYFVQAGPVLKRYPAEWQARAHLADADAALNLGRLELADAALRRLPKELTHRDALEAKLDKARIDAAQNHYKDAAPAFAAVTDGGDERLAAKAIFYQANAALKAGVISAPRAIEILERLRFRWRGDGLEMQTLRKLASLYFGKGDWRAGLKTLRVAAGNFSGETARSAQDDMRAAFVNLYLKGAADKMAPVESLGLFYDNIDLTPIGTDGDTMIRHMVDRLVAVDLLGPAARLLAYQVDNRLDGVAKADVSTKLAGIYLMDHKAQEALDTLHASQIAGLPDGEIHDRLLLEARSFAALKHWDNALDLIAVDTGADTARLRADIYWESGNWEAAGQKTEALLDMRWSDAAPLNDSERAEVLRMAVAYSLANNEGALDRLRERFAPKMKGTNDASAFAVLAAPIELHGIAFRDAARQIAQVDTLATFMKDFSKRKQILALN